MVWLVAEDTEVLDPGPACVPAPAPLVHAQAATATTAVSSIDLMATRIR